MTIEAEGSNDAQYQEIADIFGLPSANDDAPAASTPPVSQAPAEAPASAEAGAAVAAPSAAPAAPPAPSAPTPPAAPLPPLEQTPASGAPAAAAPVAAPVVDEQALRIRSLEASLAAVQTQLEAKTAATPAGTTPATGNDQDQPEVVPYGLTIPDQVSDAIFGEDPVQAKNALNHLMSSLASVVHTRALHQVRGEMRAEFGKMATQATEATQVTAAADMQQQFFTAYPQFKDAVYQPILYAVNSELAAALPNHPWDENYIAALGQRMNARMAQIAGGSAPAQPAPAPAPAIAPKPAAMVPTAPRDQSSHGIPSFERELPDQVSDIFGAT